MENKTPITILEEYCAKYKKPKPIYEFLEEDSIDVENLDDTERKFQFFCKCIALNQFSIKGGRAKKDAKHNAALQLVTMTGVLQGSVASNSDASVTNNAITELLDICVQRNLEKAEFTEVDSTGPSHAPLFTIKCEISSLRTVGQHSTKKRAKQIAAANMIEVLNKMHPDSDKKLVVIGKKIESDTKTRIKSYIEYKRQDESNKKELGVKMKDRHKFFANLEEEIRKPIEEVLRDNTTTDTYKYKKLKEVFEKLEYETVEDNFENSLQAKLKYHELLIDFDQFTCLWIDTDDSLHHNVIQYYKVMFGIIKDFDELDMIPFPKQLSNSSKLNTSF